jgi:hypothetical protein
MYDVYYPANDSLRSERLRRARQLHVVGLFKRQFCGGNLRLMLMQFGLTLADAYLSAAKGPAPGLFGTVSCEPLIDCELMGLMAFADYMLVDKGALMFQGIVDVGPPDAASHRMTAFMEAMAELGFSAELASFETEDELDEAIGRVEKRRVEVGDFTQWLGAGDLRLAA